MIDCPNGDVRDVLPDYVNDRLDAPRRFEVEAHLASCASCRDEVELLRDLRATMRRTPTVNAEAIVAAIPPYRAPVRHGWATGWRTAAAIAAIAVGGASFALLRDEAPTHPGVERTAIAPPSRERIDSPPSSGLPPVAQVPGGSRSSAPASTPTRELAMAGSAIGELSDGELSVLVEGLESLDALPATEVDGAEPLPASALEDS
jgi:anti-sigma factor RsiW